MWLVDWQRNLSPRNCAPKISSWDGYGIFIGRVVGKHDVIFNYVLATIALQREEIDRLDMIVVTIAYFLSNW